MRFFWSGAFLSLVAVTVGTGDSSRPDVGINGASSRPTFSTLQRDTAARVIRFSTSDGTWMSLDVSPDGQTIVFDLLGDLYTIPLAGGLAHAVTSGPGWDVQPRFSPDGAKIAFVSDRSGIANLWLVDRDGQRGRPVSNLRYNVVGSPISSPSWSPDGQTIILSQRWGSDKPVKFLWDSASTQTAAAAPVRPLTSAMQPQTWLPAIYDVASGRMRWVINSAATRVRPMLGSVFAADGRTAYAAAQSYPLDYSGAINFWRIERLSLATGVSQPEMGAALARSAIRPVLSHNGRLLAYASPSGNRYGLRLRDLQTLRERWLVTEEIEPTPLLGDVAGSAYLDLMPGYAFTPDDSSLIVAFGGKIHRIEVATGRQKVIPFLVNVQRELAPMAVRQFALADTSLPTRSVMYPALSPDGRQVAFSALDRLWVMDLSGDGRAGHQPLRLTADSNSEGYPSWSPDGRWIAYSAWREGEGGMLRRAWVPRMPQPTPLPTQRLSSDTALYYGTAVAASGQRIAAIRAELPPARRSIPYDVWDATTNVREAQSVSLVALPSAGGRPTTIQTLPVAFVGPDATSRLPTEQLYFTSDTSRIYVGLGSFALDGSDRRLHLALADAGQDDKMGNDVSGVFAPNARRALLTCYWTLSEVSLPAGAGTATDTLNVTEAQRRPFGDVSGAARPWGRALFPWISWSRDGRRVLFVQGGTLFVGDVPAKGWTRFTPVSVPLLAPVDIPRGTLVLHDARLITLRQRFGRAGATPEVIGRGDLIVRDNRIVGLGQVGTVSIPKDATVFNLAGKTIIPGYVDIHDHWVPPYGVTPVQQWGLLTRLAHGVTALRNPGEPHMQFGEFHKFRELEREGALVGPRLFTTGVPHLATRQLAPLTLQDALAVVHPNAEYFDTETFKEYTSDPWPNSRLIAEAAAAAGLNATIHGDHLRAIVDGFTGVEHNLAVPLYDDVLTFIAKSGTTLTNTFGVTASAISFILIDGREPWAYPRIRRFVPPGLREHYSGVWLASVSLFGRPEPENLNALLRGAAGIVARGGLIGMGSHGNIPGMGMHYEMWFHASGGMSTHDILRSATIVSATAIGHGKDFGSLEAGKLADLQILDRNPLDDIRNTLSIRYVMKNGRLYGADDLAEVWPRRKTLPPIYLFDDSSEVSVDRPSYPRSLFPGLN